MQTASHSRESVRCHLPRPVLQLALESAVVCVRVGVVLLLLLVVVVVGCVCVWGTQTTTGTLTVSRHRHVDIRKCRGCQGCMLDWHQRRRQHCISDASQDADSCTCRTFVKYWHRRCTGRQVRQSPTPGNGYEMGIADLADYNLGSHTQDSAAVSLCRDLPGCMTRTRNPIRNP